MALYRRKSEIVVACQWFKNGDHPKDDVFRPFEDTGQVPTEPREGKVVRYFRHPGYAGESKCATCGRRFHDHGFIDRPGYHFTVCPGDWIVNMPDGRHYRMAPEIFEATYEPTEEAVVP